MSQPRIPPRPVEEWTEEIDDAFSVLRTHAPQSMSGSEAAATRPRSNILGIYAWHPDLIRGWMPFSNHLRHSTLSDRLREMVIIRTTWLGFGEYEWAQHVRMSRAGGYLSDAEIDALCHGPDDELWSADDAALVRAIDEMCTYKTIVDATWAQIEAQLSRQQLIDFVFTVGTYDMHCSAFNALGLQLEDGMTGFPVGHRRDS